MMSIALGFSLFLLGTAVGSFLNVLIWRFREEEGFFHSRSLTGRSRCPYCRRTLRWYELLPLLSFLVQLGRCRRCGRRLSWQYPFVEFLSGLIFLWPLYFYSISPEYLVFSIIIVLAALALLTLSAIDLRFFIIPDQITLFLIFLAALAVFVPRPNSFLGPQAFLADFLNNAPANKLLGAFAGLLLLGLIYFVSRGRAMGFGDVKLAGALGLFLGWPDIVITLALAFVIGAFFGFFWLWSGRKKMKTLIPFGPFIAAAVFVVLLYGRPLVAGYFNLFNLL